IHTLKRQDRPLMDNFIRELDTFTDEEKAVIHELLDIFLYQEKQKDYHFDIAVIDQNIAAFICYGPTPMSVNTYDLYWIATHPNYRKNGLAHELIESMKTRMRSSGAKKIRIETSSQELYHGTQKFYERENFK